jgi:hypothetical protein
MIEFGRCPPATTPGAAAHAFDRAVGLRNRALDAVLGVVAGGAVHGLLRSFEHAVVQNDVDRCCKVEAVMRGDLHDIAAPYERVGGY